MSSILILGDIFFEILYIYTKDLFGDNRYIIPNNYGLFCEFLLRK